VHHNEDMHYLNTCKGDFNDLRLLQYPSMRGRAYRMFMQLITTNFKAGATDQFTQAYCDKLEAYSVRRNKHGT
jgi:hypothetical protein